MISKTIKKTIKIKKILDKIFLCDIIKLLIERGIFYKYMKIYDLRILL